MTTKQQYHSIPSDPGGEVFSSSRPFGSSSNAIAGPSTPPGRPGVPHGHSGDDEESEEREEEGSPTVTSLLLPPPLVRSPSHGEDMDFDDSDSSSVFEDEEGGNAGTDKVEAARSVWGPRSQWFLFIGIGLSSYIYSLDGLTTWQYLNFATSYVLEHSLSGTISTAQAIIIAVGKPFMAKLADVVGRGETFIIVTILYVLGYGIIATAYDIRQIATGSIIYAFGYTGLQMMQQIVIADMTTLRWRGLVSALVSAPFIINNFISAEITARILPNWVDGRRWGYGMFAILVPLSLLPIIGALLWAQRKARKRTKAKYMRPQLHRKWSTRVNESCEELDLIGLLIVATSLSLVLLPLGLAPHAQGHWQNPGMIVMITLGTILFPFFIWFEARIPSKPVMPMRWLRRGPILGACLIGFFDFVSFFLQHTYLYSYVYVTRDWTYRGLTYFSAIQTISLTIFGIVGGWLMYHTQRFKETMLICGLLIRLLGVILMLKARSLSGTPLELILTQALQGAGGGFAAIAIQVSAQAAVSHADVATVTAMVLLLTEVGNSVGSAVATGVWTQYMPQELALHVPTTNQTLLDELFGSMENIARYPITDPIRKGAIVAYENVMERLVFAAVITAIFPPIFCILLTKNIKLGKTQNARDKRDLSGRPVGEDGAENAIGRGKPRGRGRVRLRSESGVSGISIFDASAISSVDHSPRTLARILEAEARRPALGGAGPGGAAEEA